MKFAKMHGLGNDFIILDNREGNLKDLESIARKACDRHFGIGADGILVIENSSIADVRMVIINSDGSYAGMCGNGIRCFSKYIYEKQITAKNKIAIETGAGIMIAELKVTDAEVSGIRIDMGKPVFDKELIPFIGKENNLLYEMEIGGKVYKVSTLLLGVPHTIIFTDEINDEMVAGIGKRVETMDLFPCKTNVNFVKVINNHKIELRTWERGAGQTLACGTGTCASVVACSLNHKTSSSVNAVLAGGMLKIDYLKGRVFMEGPAEFICEGFMNIK